MKTLFLFWHGLGDNILATPAIKKYKETTGDSVGWAMCKEFESAGLFDLNPHIDNLHWVSNPWRGAECFPKGCLNTIREVDLCHSEGAVINSPSPPCRMRPGYLPWDIHHLGHFFLHRPSMIFIKELLHAWMLLEGLLLVVCLVERYHSLSTNRANSMQLYFRRMTAWPRCAMRAHSSGCSR